MLLAVECVELPRVRGDRETDVTAACELLERAIAAAGIAPRDVAWLAAAANGTHVDALEAGALDRRARRGFAPVRSDVVRAAAGDAFTATPVLQAIEALPVVASGRIAAVFAISLFGGASVLLLGPP